MFEVYKSFHVWVLNQLGKQIKCLHTDHGGEYLSDEFNSFLDENGVERKLTVHDTPEENGIAERLNCTLQEKVCTMIYAAKLPEGLWGEALMHTAWLKNCTWTCSLLKGLTPYEMVTGETPVLCEYLNGVQLCGSMTCPTESYMNVPKKAVGLDMT